MVRWTVQSFTKPCVGYVVEHREGQWTCTCPDFTFRKRMCKHIAQVQQELSRPEYVKHPMLRENAIEERDYQMRMVDEALEGNALIVLTDVLGILERVRDRSRRTYWVYRRAEGVQIRTS